MCLQHTLNRSRCLYIRQPVIIFFPVAIAHDNEIFTILRVFFAILVALYTWHPGLYASDGIGEQIAVPMEFEVFAGFIELTDVAVVKDFAATQDGSALSALFRRSCSS